MTADAPIYWLFLFVVWALWLLLPGIAARKLWLLAASYIFYASWQPWYAGLLGGATVVSFGVGLAVRQRRNRVLLMAGLTAFTGGLALAKGWLNPLPIGLSFYTLQAIGWMTEAYREGASASLLDYSLYMAFFPRLAAGPIVRAEEFLPQLKERERVDSTALWEASLLLITGLFKKLVIADNLGAAADPVFANLPQAPAGKIILATLAFSVQLYCDFAGYTDLALGAARLFGLRLPENFRWPYLARHPADFWRRWHISLSSWLRDYVYFSLPGNRSRHLAQLNLLVTMALVGVWHGYRWTFLLWGIYHGVLLVMYHATSRRWLWNSIAGVLAMDVLTVLGWVLFRIERLSDLPVYIKGLLSRPSPATFYSSDWFAVTLLLLTAAVHLLQVRFGVWERFFNHRWNPWGLCLLLLMLVTTGLLSLPAQQMFLYFRF